MRLTMVTYAIQNGGAERVVATMANGWAARGWELTLLTYDDGREPPFYPLDARIDHRSLGIVAPTLKRTVAVRNNLGRVKILRRAIRDSRPDAVISHLDTVNVAVLLATWRLDIPTIVMEHTDPAQKRLGGAWKRLRRATYPHASRVVVLSETAGSYFPPSIRAISTVLPNPIAVDLPAGDERPDRDDARTVVAMGRFSEEKGFDLLIDAFARIAPAHPGWNLVIWGDGPLRPEMESLRDRLGLHDRVLLPGRTTTPFRELRRGDLFAMSSRREGFPMALGEAMACGLPAVSFDCPSGPRQIIREGIDGLLVPDGDVLALSAAMSRLMSDDDERRRMAERAVDVAERFGAERVLGQWEELLGQVVRDHRSNSNPSSRHPKPTHRRSELAQE